MTRMYRQAIFLRATGVLMACALAGVSLLAIGRQAEGRPGDAAGFFSMRTAHVSLRYEAGMKAAVADRVAATLERLRTAIGHDFGVYQPGLRVRMFATHAAFVRALWHEQRQRPQTPADDASRIIHGTLLLGPLPAAYLWHDLPHEYTEWVLDHLTHNAADVLPGNTWLYDGLAEYEAYRYAPAGFRCAAGTAPPFDVTRVRTAEEWMTLRRGPLGSLEYCLAYLAVRRVVERVGWDCLVRQLQARDVWGRVADRLAAGRGACRMEE